MTAQYDIIVDQFKVLYSQVGRCRFTLSNPRLTPDVYG
jgi:hypothetical protein